MRELFGCGLITYPTPTTPVLSCISTSNPFPIPLANPPIPADTLVDFLGTFPQLGAGPARESTQLNTPEIQLLSLHPCISGSGQTACYAAITGNLGSEPTLNPKGDRWSASIAIPRPPEVPTATWIRVICPITHPLAAPFSALPSGTHLTILGTVHTYDHKSKPRLHVELLSCYVTPNTASSYAPRPALYEAPRSIESLSAPETDIGPEPAQDEIDF